VEGKVSEPFGPLVSEWFQNPSEGKKERLAFLCKTLGLDEEQVQSIRYQLLHRTASAVIEAERFNAKHALMLVHSFSSTSEWFDDFKAFARLFDAEADLDQLLQAGRLSDIDLYLGWIKGEVAKATHHSEEGIVVAKKCAHCGHHEIGIHDKEGNFRQLKPGDKVKLSEG
jgi:hypothetical protein